MTRTIKLENLGPVAEVTIPIPEPGGVVVLRGRNGAGKSETLEAVNKMLGRNADTPTPIDGLERGQIEGLGVKLTVGRTTRRTGELEVLSLDSRLSVADVVDPGIKDAEGADEKRMKAILAILQVKPDLNDWAALADELAHEVGGDWDAVIRSEVARADDVLVAAARIKAEISRAACRAEASQRDAQALVDAISRRDPRAVGHEDTPPLPPLAQLAQELSQAQKRLHALQQRQAEAQQVDAWKAELAELRSGALDVDLCRSEGNQAAEALEQARRALAEAEAAFEAADSRLQTAQQVAGRVKALSDRVLAATPPTDDELAQAALAVQAGEQAIADYEATRQLAAAREQCRVASEDCARQRLKAEALRQAMERPEAILAQMVQSRVDGVKFRSGRLIVSHPKRGDIPFAELSTGERWRFAVQVAIYGVGAGGLIVIPQDAWQDLDPQNRGKVAKLARSAGVVILTAECSADPALTTEVL